MTTFLSIMGAIIVGGLALTKYFFRPGGVYNPKDPFPPKTPSKPGESTDGGKILVPGVPAPEVLLFDTPQHSFHAVRVLCDNAGLTLEEKNTLCACVYQESGFHNNAINHNKNSSGVTTSTDWGICQINDYYHCGPGKEFPSSAYVVAHPDDAVKFMIKCQEQGLLRLWVSYSSGAYQQWLKPGSPMWALKV